MTIVPTLTNTLPYPEIYEEAADLVRRGIEDYCCHAITRALMGTFNYSTYLRHLNVIYQDQFYIGFGDSEFWDKLTNHTRRKARVKALLKMARMCKPKKD